MLGPLVGNETICSNSASWDNKRSFSLKQHGKYESVKDPNCQSIPGQLKSPPRKIFEFGYFTLTSATECDKSSHVVAGECGRQ